MIVKISRSGASFKGLSQYLTHDPSADTDERVAWTHTHNLANDDIPSAINEMYLTSENAELLKQEAGIRAGGRQSERPVKHVSLNWDPRDNPSQAHMIKTSQNFLESMGWAEHQAIFVAHSDKEYKHVHIVLNAIHPETGRHLSESWENNRAQKWAAEYERAQDCIRCPQRGLPYGEREKSMPRNMWLAFQQNEKSFLRGEELLLQNSGEIPEMPSIKNSEWKILKDIQRLEREQFIADGKIQFCELRNSVYREVKDEFRERWKDYYTARNAGADENILREMKQGIVDDRKAMLEPRRDAACKELLESRKAEFRDILDSQRDQRQTLKWHQELGLDTSDFFHELNTRRDASLVTDDFRETALEVTAQRAVPAPHEHVGSDFAEAAAEVAQRPLGGLGSFAASMADSFFTELTNLGSARPEPRPQADREQMDRSAVEDATKQREQIARDLDDEDWRHHRSKELHGRE